MDKKDMKNKRPPKPKMDMKILGRVMGYIFRNYKYRMFFVLFCIVCISCSKIS
jgi:hypothetical protein